MTELTGDREIGKALRLSAAAALLFLLWATPVPAARLLPADLEYRGAFRLPGPGGGSGWGWSGNALAYHPGGDPSGPADGYPGSLFGTGHNWYQHVSEITIPVPVISPNKNLADLNTASTLQPFTDIRGNLYDYLDFEMPRAGLAVLPARGGQTSPKLYFSWGQHLQQETTDPCLGWRELDLDGPPSSGVWRVGNYLNQVTTDYLFTVPRDWADAHVSGMSLAAGRYQDGGQGAQGPALIVCAPWEEGNPPASGRTMAAVPLLLYDPFDAPDPRSLDGYHHSDDWPGAAWLAGGGKEAVIFAGTKGRGDCWYGNESGPCLQCDNRGWWSDYFDGEIIFYDPADFAAVAAGTMEPSEPQPYAVMNVDQLLYGVTGVQQKYHLAAAAADQGGGYLYVLEPLVDNDKPIVHVWKVTGGGGGEVVPRPGDYNGDGAADIAVFRPSNGLWAVRGQTRVYFGAAGDIPVPGDYTGDGSCSPAIFRPDSGLWAVRNGGRAYFGTFGDTPVPGYYEGSGTVQAAIFRPAAGLWAVRGLTRLYFGGGGDIPVPGRYTGGAVRPAIFRPDSGLWAVRGVTRVYFGFSADIPVPGDYNGNGNLSPAVFRPAGGLWAVRGMTRFYFGGPGDLPLAADFRGDGSAPVFDQAAIFRDSSGLWAIRGFTRVYFGGSRNTPGSR